MYIDTKISIRFDRALRTGYVDPAVEPPNYIEQLIAGDLDTFLAEVQSHYADWKAAKGE